VGEQAPWRCRRGVGGPRRRLQAVTPCPPGSRARARRLHRRCSCPSPPARARVGPATCGARARGRGFENAAPRRLLPVRCPHRAATSRARGSGPGARVARRLRRVRQTSAHVQGGFAGAARALRRRSRSRLGDPAPVRCRRALARNHRGAQASLPTKVVPPVKRRFRIESSHAGFSRSPPRWLRAGRAVGARRPRGRAVTARPPGSRARVRGLRRRCSCSSPPFTLAISPTRRAVQCARVAAASRMPRRAFFSPLGVPAAQAYAPNAQSAPGARAARRPRRARQIPEHGHEGFTGVARALRCRPRARCRPCSRLSGRRTCGGCAR
jgi:hypothetical protein